MMNSIKYIDSAFKMKDVFGFKNMTNTLSVINRSTSIESSVHTNRILMTLVCNPMIIQQSQLLGKLIFLYQI